MKSDMAMYGAIVRNYVPAARALVASDPEVLGTCFLQDSWLHWAAKLSRIEIMQVLVEAGMAVDHLTLETKTTPLKTAAGQGHLEACEWLLDHGGDINHGLGAMATPVFSSVFSKSLDLVKLFVARGADLRATFSNPKIDLLDFADLHGTPEILAFLKKAIAKGNKKATRG